MLLFGKQVEKSSPGTQARCPQIRAVVFLTSGVEEDPNFDSSRTLSLSCIGEGNGNPLQCSCLENPRDGGDWRAAVYGVTQSRT